MAQDLPGHIRRAFRSIERFVPVTDLIVELLDARMPRSSQLHGLVKRLGKASLIILGKCDLANPAETRRWVEFFSRDGQHCIPLDARDPSSVKAVRERVRRVATEAGIRATPGMTRTMRRLMVIGIPNVGKSTLINAIAGRRATKVANLPGVTRHIQWVKLPGNLELLDLPGVLDFGLLRRGEILRLINTLPGPNEDPIGAARVLVDMLIAISHADMLPGWKESGEVWSAFLPHYASDRHFLGRGGEPDERRAAIDLLKRFQDASFGRLTLEKYDDPPSIRTVIEDSNFHGESNIGLVE
ncbi:MAG: 50S ribosome-binding GTPase [Candidatus Riflebacteria bacterium]|nr:50S ribosome-binding GTPase [Candidatus Riflebacteria bacterium]